MQPNKTLEQRFWEKVDKSGDCWNWTSAVGSRGYGIFWVGGKRRNKFAHRLGFELHYGFEPKKEEMVCHRCDNKLCVKPDHLFLGSAKDNMQDAARKGRMPRGEANKGGGKLTELDVKVIKGRFHTVKEASRIFYVSENTVKRIRRGTLWKHV